MKKIISLFVLLLVSIPCHAGLFNKNKKLNSTLILSKTNPLVFDNFDNKIQDNRYFKKGEKIYFLIQNPNNFKSNYVKYQIIKQDDNAHIGGYTIIQNKTKRINNKTYFSDYFVLWQSGKYFLQVFDITDTNHWLNLEGFRVIDE